MSSAPPPLSALPKAPAAIKVFGILKVAFGVLGLLAGAQGMIQNPETKAIVEEAPSFAELTSPALQLPGMVISVGFILAGIALLKKISWSRVSANVITIISFLWGIGSGFIMYPIFVDSLDQVQSGIGKTAIIAGMVAAVFATVSSLVYTVFALIYLNRWNVRNYLNERRKL